MFNVYQVKFLPLARQQMSYWDTDHVLGHVYWAIPITPQPRFEVKLENVARELEPVNSNIGNFKITEGEFQEMIAEFKNLRFATENRTKCEEVEIQEGVKSNKNSKYVGGSK